jgi:hypothetical protein
VKDKCQLAYKPRYFLESNFRFRATKIKGSIRQKPINTGNQVITTADYMITTVDYMITTADLRLSGMALYFVSLCELFSLPIPPISSSRL